MNPSMAECTAKYGPIDEPNTSIILAPNVVLTLYLDGSATFQSSSTYRVYESCWQEAPHERPQRLPSRA